MDKLSPLFKPPVIPRMNGDEMHSKALVRLLPAQFVGRVRDRGHRHENMHLPYEEEDRQEPCNWA